MTTTILQLSDLHPFADPDERLFGIPTRELLEDVLAHVRDSGIRPDHVVVTGDRTHDERPETYAAVRELLEPFIDRLWLLPGNHDDRAVLRAAFDDRIPADGADRITFSFRAGDWLCLGLDTHAPARWAGASGQSRSMGRGGARRAPPPGGRALHAPSRRSSSAGRGSTVSASRTASSSESSSRGSLASGSSAAATSTTSRRTGSARRRS